MGSELKMPNDNFSHTAQKNGISDKKNVLKQNTEISPNSPKLHKQCSIKHINPNICLQQLLNHHNHVGEKTP